jgi:cyclopropane fatty-acyl-phospholipid synthase-like methyltransferase
MDYQSMYNSIIERTSRDPDTDLVCKFEVLSEGNKIERINFHVKYMFDVINLLEAKTMSYLKKGDKVLDVGTAAGRRAKDLQIQGHDVVAFDKSKKICECLKKSGIKKIVNKDFFKYFPQKKYDCVLFIKMYHLFGNTREDINYVFEHVAKNILNKKGRLIFILYETPSGKSELFKRRLVLNGEPSDWFEGITPSFSDLVQFGKNNNFHVKKHGKDTIHKSQYYLILEKNS